MKINVALFNWNIIKKNKSEKKKAKGNYDHGRGKKKEKEITQRRVQSSR